MAISVVPYDPAWAAAFERVDAGRRVVFLQTLSA